MTKTPHNLLWQKYSTKYMVNESLLIINPLLWDKAKFVHGNTNFHSEAVLGILRTINSLILHPAPSIWSSNLQSPLLRHIPDLLCFKNNQQMICISPCRYPHGTENIQINFIYFVVVSQNALKTYLYLGFTLHFSQQVNSFHWILTSKE